MKTDWIPERIVKALKPVRHFFLRKDRKYEKRECEMAPYRDMQKLLAGSEIKRSSIIDGGAWKGDTAILLSEMFPAATVYAFEPSKDLFKDLCHNTRDIASIMPINCALDSSSGKRKFYLTEALHSSSLYHTSALSLKYYAEMTKPCGIEVVDTVTIDEWAKKLGVSFVDIIKLDLEGAELEALKGAERILLEGVKLILCEVQFAQLKDNAPLFCEIEAFLMKRGFYLYQLYDLHSGEDGRLLYGDAMFMRTLP